MPALPRKRFLAAASVLVAAALLAWISHRLDWRATWEHVRQVGIAGFAAFTLCSLAPLVMQAAGWQCLMRARGWKVPFRVTMTSYLMGNAVAYIAPSLYLGGEPVKIWHISRRLSLPSDDVAATVITNKFAEFAGFLVALLPCVGAMLWSFDLPRGILLGSTSVAAGLFLVFLVVTAAFVGEWPILSGLMRAPGKRFAKVRKWARDLERSIAETFRERRGAFAAALLLTGSSLWVIVLEPFVFFHFAGHHAGFPAVALIFVMSQIALAFHVTPGGLGVFEQGMIWSFALIGLGSPEAAAFAAVHRLSDAILVAAGLVLAGREGASGFLGGARPD